MNREAWELLALTIGGAAGLVLIYVAAAAISVGTVAAPFILVITAIWWFFFKRSLPDWIILLVLVGSVVLLFVGCVPRARWIPPTYDVAAQQRDVVECAALAGQAAQGRGTMFSDRSFQSGYEGALREEYLARCLASRGWRAEIVQ